MSRLIEQLRASDFPDRSARDLTLEVGEFLERNKRDDVFTANPDFAQEYYAVKDEIQRLKRPSVVDEFKGSFGSAVDELQASAYGAGALVAHGARAVGIPGAESARNKLLDLMRGQEEEAKEFQPSVGSFTDIKNLSDVGRYVTYGLGTIGPSLLQSGASAAIGAGIGAAAGSTVAPGPGTAGGAVGGFMLGLAEKKLAQRAVSELMERGAKNVVLADVAKALTREAVEAEAKRLAQTMGAQAAMGVSSIAAEAGSIYKEDTESPWIAAGYGAVAGLLDVLPESLIVSRILGPVDAVTKEAADEARTYLRRFAQQAAVNIPLEASTETAQTLLEIAAAKHGRGESPTSFTDEDYKHALNAGIIGAMGGGVMTVPAAIPNPTARPNPIPAITDRTLEAMEIPDMAAPGGALDFGSEISDRALTAVPPDIQREFDRETRQDGFGPADSAPYELGGATGLPGPGRVSPAGDAINQQIRKAGGAAPVAPAPAVQLPQSVLNAVENAEEAARAWEMRMEARNNPSSELPNGEQAAAREFPDLPAAPAPLQPSEMEQMRPASEVITDAPLGRLIGREVEYFGTRGVLIRDELGNFVVLPPIQSENGPLPVEVTGTGKDPAMLASEAAVTPLEPANPIPKPAPAVPMIGGPTSPGISRQPSKVPFGDLAPNDLVPRQDITVNIPNVPPVPLPRPAAAPAAPTVVSGAASGGMPAGSVDKVAAIETPGEETMPLVDPSRKFSRSEITGQRRAVRDLEDKAEKAANVSPMRAADFQRRARLARDRLTQMQAQRMTGTRPVVGVAPDGSDDLLSDIAEYVGLIQTQDFSGGEGDDIVRALERGVAQRLRGGKKGMPPDQMLGILNDDAGYKFQSISELAEAISKAVDNRQRVRRDMESKQTETRQAEDFAAVVLENKKRRGGAKSVAKDPGTLKVGETFKAAREKFEVVDIDETTGEVIVRDGPRFGTQRIPPDGAFYPDRGTLRRLKEDEVKFLDDEDVAEEAAPPVVVPTPPVVRPRPTDEQVAASTNGVEAMTDDALQNIRRLQVFTQPRPAPAIDQDVDPDAAPIEQPETVPAGYIRETPFEAIDRAVGRQVKGSSNWSVVVVDLGSGEAYMRSVYRGASNELLVDFSARRVGIPGQQGSTASPEADLLAGAEGRPLKRMLTERLADGSPRFSVWGLAELSRATGARNLNMGPAVGLEGHPMLAEAARRFWQQEARANPATLKKMPAAQSSVDSFAQEMAAWRRENPGEEAAARMATRIAEFAKLQVKAFGAKLSPEQIDAWTQDMIETVEQIARVEFKQSVLLSADYTVPASYTVDLFRSALRALTRDRNVNVVAFEQALTAAADRAARTTGMVINQDGQRKILAFALQSLNGPVNADTILSLLHEVGHVVTDGLPEPLRVAFHEAVRTMPHRQARWLKNPRSLDARLLANADPASLSPEQRAALQQLTAEEIAAARRIDPAVLVEEQAAEHLAQFGWDRAEARGAIQKLIRFAKELWLRMAIAVQRAMKGPDHVSPTLARQYVENRFLQFVHRDSALASDRISDLLNWLGVRPTARELIPVLPAGRDTEQRMQHLDAATGRLIPIDHGVYTPDGQAAYLRQAIEHATQYAELFPDGAADESQARFTKRVMFSAPLSFTPSRTTNTIFAALNLESEIYRQIAQHPDIGRFLPPGDDFVADWLTLPPQQAPSARVSEATAWADQQVDPMTQQPVRYDAQMTVDNLPSTEEQIRDRDGRTIKVQISESQDKALQFTIQALGDAQRRIVSKIKRETDRLAELKRQQKRNPADFPADSLEELTKLEESIPLRAKIAEQLVAHSNRLLAKFQPGDLVSVYAGAPYLRVPGPDATEQQIRDARKGTVPRDLKFTDLNRTQLGADLAAMEAWLLNADNRNKGKIYGVVSETYRKLMLIPTFQQRAATAALMRQTITGSFADEFRKSGMPSVRLLGKKMAEVAAVVNRYDDPLVTAGATWSTAAARFAESLGLPFDQGFYERIWDPMMRTWNFIDVAERNQIGTPGEANLFTTIEGAFKQFSGVALDSDAKRARMRDLLMATIEVERITREIFEANPSLKVHDKEMGVYRRLVSHGLATGRRQVSQHIEGLFVQMNPQWSSTKPVLAGDTRSFWESIPDAYSTERAAFDAAVAELFPGYVVRDFVEPVIANNVQVFSVVDQDGTPRKASLLRVRQAWSKAGGDVIKFAEALHQLEGGDPAGQSRTVASVLNGFRGLFAEIKAERDARLGAEANKHEVLPRQMMDARRAQDWPAEWVSYAGYDQMSNLMLLHQLGLSAAFGPDPLAADGELNGTIKYAKEELAGLHFRYDEMARAGRTAREIEAAMGREDYALARNAKKIQHNLDRVAAAFSAMSSVTNYLTGDLKAMNDALGFAATMMVQSPRAGLINLSDLLGAVRGLKLSRPALKALGTAINSFTAEVGNTLVQAFGQNAAWNVEAARRRVKINGRDSAGHIAWREKLNNIGPRGVMAKPSGPETLGSKAQRVISRTFLRARDIIPNVGSPLQGTSEAQTLAPKARWGVFPNSVLSTMGANVDAAVEVFADLAAKGIEYINQIPAQDRAQFVRHLELGIQDLSAEQLGYFGGLILNDAAAFDSLRGALADKVPGESTVGRFVAKAFRRHEAAAGGEFELISDSQFAGIANYANSEWTLQSNFSSLPYWMQAGPMRPLFIFLTWPYLAMRAFGKTFTDADGRMTWWGANSTVKDGLMAFFVLTAPLTIAASFAIDWYDKYLLGKRQNLREANWLTAVPVVGAIADPHAFVERVGRYGGAGFATDIINQLVNYDTERNLSLDTRIVAVNAISNLLQSAVATPIRQDGNITYASVVRPFLQSIGAGGMLQYLQIGNNLLGLNTQDAAINSRINTGNYIRAAGRVLDLPVRVFTGPQSVPTPVTPYLQQMELAALVNNTDLFRSAYRQAVDAARDQDRTTEQARKYVADNFAERHPLRRLFKGSISETDYRKILSEIDPYGSAQVRASINSYNRYLRNWFGKPAYYGKASQQGSSVESLIRQADRINSGAASMESLLAIP